MRNFLLQSKGFVVAVAFVVANLYLVGSSWGQTNTWDGSTDANWNTAANWSLNLVPIAAHDVEIPNNFNVTVNTNAVCASFTINSGANNNTVTISGSNSLTVTGAVTINEGTGTNDDKIISVGAGSLICASITIANTGGNNDDSEVTITTGTVTVSGNITMNGTATRNAIRISGTGTLNLGGSISLANGTLDPGTGGSTVNYNGSGNQTIRNVTYENLSLSTSGIKTPNAGFTVNDALTIDSGTTLDEATFTLTLPGGASLVVNGTLDFTASGGLIQSGTSGTTTLTMGSSGLIRTVDPVGLGPVANGSLVTGAGGAWVTTSISTNGTVEYYLNALQVVTDRDYNHLTITNGVAKTWTLGASRTVNGNVTVAGTLTLASGQTINAKGNWTNNGGTFTPSTTTIAFNSTAADQNINGTAVTQTFNSITVAKSTTKLIIGGSTTTVTAGGTNPVLTITSGNIDCGTATLELGTGTGAAAAGTLTYTNGNIIGKFKRWFDAAGAKQFPLGTSAGSGTASANRNVLVTFTNLTNGSLTGNFIATDPGASGLPLTENSLTFSNQFTEGYWSLVAANSLASTNYALELTGDGFVSYPQDANMRIIKRPDGGGSWTLNGTHVAAVGAIAKRSTLSGFSEFGVAANCPDPTIDTQPTSPAAVCAGTGTPSFSVVASPGGLTYQWQESTAGTGGPFANVANGGVYSGATTATLTITNPPFSMNGYAYRVVVTRSCGSTATSNGLAVLTVDQQPVVSNQPNQTQCNTSTFTMTQSAPSPGTGIWTLISGSATITTPSSPTTTITAVAAGTSATVRWTVTNGTCSAFDEVTVTNYANPTATASAPSPYNGAQISCFPGQGTSNNGSATVTPAGGTPGYTYDWNGTPAGDGTATITGLVAGTYTVTVTDANLCFTTTMVTLTGPIEIIAFTCNYIQDGCQLNEGEIQVVATGGTGVLNATWTAICSSPPGPQGPGGPSPVPITFTGLTGNCTYSIKVTDANGCIDQ